MSAAQTIPMFSPDGSLGDVPIEQAQAARTAGAVPAVNILDPQGNPGHVPANRVQEAVQAGAKVVPFGQQEVAAHPGILATIGSDLKGMFTNIPQVTSPYPGMDLERKQQVAQQSVAEDQARQKAGYGPLYRAAAPIAEAAGTNVPGMEQAAAEGNARGVIGHALAGAGVAAAPLAAEGAVRGAKAGLGTVADAAHSVPRPDFLKPTDVLTETTPARISELKSLPQKLEAVRQSVVDAEQAAKARASAAFPKIEQPVQVGTETVYEPTGQTDDFGEVSHPTEKPVYTTFDDLQEQRSNTLANIAEEKRLVARGVKPRYDLVREYERLSTIDELMNKAAAAEGKMDQLTAARQQFKQYMDDYHNPGSPARGVLDAKPGESAKVASQLLNPDTGARLLETLRKSGVDTSGMEGLLTQGARPLKVSVTESAKLRKAGSDLAYKQQRYREAIRQTQVNEIPSAAEARLPKGALGGRVSNALGEIPGASIFTPRRITGFRLQRALDALGGQEAPGVPPEGNAPAAPTSGEPGGPPSGPGPKASGNGGTPKVPNSTADVQSRSGNAAGAAQENGILAQVQKEHPDWSVSQQLMEAGKRSERRAGPRNGHVFTEEERQKFLDREREVEAARHPNKWLKENPFDKDPLARELAKRETERMLQGGEDILSGKR